MSGVGRPAVPRRAVVAFDGAAQLPWLRLLKPGFRHCFVVLHDGARWILFDPLSTGVEIAVLPVDGAVDLAAIFRSQGLAAVETVARRPARPLPPGPWSCVEAVKRAIGLRAPLVLTPWQLYRRLRREQPHPGLDITTK